MEGRDAPRLVLAWSVLVAAGLGLSAVLSPQQAASQPGATPLPPDVPPGERGRMVYMVDCAWCHGNRAEGTGSGPPLTNVGEAAVDLYLTTGRMPISSVDEPVRRRPPAYDPETIGQVVSFVAGLGDGPRTPRVDPDRGDRAAGAELYLVNCAACHGATMAGAALTQGDVATSLYDSTPVQIAQSVVVGPGTMPVLSPPLERREVDSIVRYILEVRDAPDAGGHPLGHLGPMPEGLAAFAATALLVAFVRWIGKRSPVDEGDA